MARMDDGLRIAVIGAGMSGILTAIRLQEAGFDNFVIHEKADRLGGTWRDNTYPGLVCDVPSHVYRYSFAPNPEWSRHYSPGPEILAYFKDVARQHGLERFVRYNSEVVRADYDGGRWRLETADGGRDVADVVIAATGVLRDPVYPDIEGLAAFAGPCFHTARWDHGIGLEGKRIGIIGTGSTAIQIVPAIVDVAAKVTLFQRTAQWIMPVPNPEFPDEQKQGFRSSPELMESMFLDLSKRFVDTFSRAVLGDETELTRIEETCRANLEENVRDRELRLKLTPDYRVACKRLIVSDLFYPAIQKPNAALVTAPIERVEPSGVRTGDGVLHELDVLVLATGFHAHRFMRPMKITGRNGVSLDEVWSGPAQAFRAVAIPGFPNFFMLVGPNSPIGNFSLIAVSELQLGYILPLIGLLRDGACREVEPKRDVTARFNETIKEMVKGTVWVSGCRSWYLDEYGNAAMWPWSFEQFQKDMARPDLAEFDLVA